MTEFHLTERPPGLENFEPPSYHRDLGQAYARIKDRWFGCYRLVVAGPAGEGGARGNVNKWRVEKRDDTADEGAPSTPDAGTCIPGRFTEDQKRGEGLQGSPDSCVQPPATPRATSTGVEPTRLSTAQLAPVSAVSTHSSNGLSISLHRA